jgi:hypothetical protein
MPNSAAAQASQHHLGSLQSANPELVPGYPLVRCKIPRDARGLGCTAAQTSMAAHGFDPAWWLPLHLARLWKTVHYPLHETADAVAEWRRLQEELAPVWVVAFGGDEGIRREAAALAAMESDLALIRRFKRDIVPAASPPPAAGHAASPLMPTMTPADLAILEALRAKLPLSLFEYDLESATSISRRTLSKRINYLIEHGLAARPLGIRSGTTITPTGAACLTSLSR